MGEISTKEGGLLKIKKFICPKMFKCLPVFYNSLFLEQTARLTPQGLLTNGNPIGPDIILNWLDANCNHPQKNQIKKHIASLEVGGVLIPNNVLEMMGLKP